MDVPWFIIVFVFVGIFVAIGAVWSAYQQKKRRERIQAVAQDLGLAYFAKGDPSLVTELSCFELFSQGRSRLVENMIHGDAGDVRVGIFDYRYTTGSGKHKRTHRQSVVYVQSPEMTLPNFTLRPENLFHKIGGIFGYRDIDFETHPKFSRTYLLRGNNEEQIRTLFSEEVLTHLEAQSSISIEASGQRLIYYRSAQVIPADQLRGFMEEGFQAFGLFRAEDA